MKIVLSGLFFPMAILRYFEAALKRRDDIELFTVGPHSGTWIPWDGGMNLPTKYAIAPNLPLPMERGGSTPVPIGYIEAQLPWQPDVWLQVDAGWFMRGKPANGRNIIIGTDPHALNYDIQRQIADVFYCMQTPYQKPGDKYLPYGYDPIWHAPEKQPKIYDVCLLGLHYSQRNILVDKLRDNGLKVRYELGPSFDEARAIYNQAPIGLNWSSKEDLCARVFELLGMKRLAIVNRVPDLERFFGDGRDLIVFKTMDEAVENVMYYHEHPDGAREIAARGHKTVQAHTWDVRVGQILSEVMSE